MEWRWKGGGQGERGMEEEGMDDGKEMDGRDSVGVKRRMR